MTAFTFTLHNGSKVSIFGRNFKSAEDRLFSWLAGSLAAYIKRTR